MMNSPDLAAMARLLAQLALGIFWVQEGTCCGTAMIFYINTTYVTTCQSLFKQQSSSAPLLFINKHLRRPPVKTRQVFLEY